VLHDIDELSGVRPFMSGLSLQWQVGDGVCSLGAGVSFCAVPYGCLSDGGA